MPIFCNFYTPTPPANEQTNQHQTNYTKTSKNSSKNNKKIINLAPNETANVEEEDGDGIGDCDEGENLTKSA